MKKWEYKTIQLLQFKQSYSADEDSGTMRLNVKFIEDGKTLLDYEWNLTPEQSGDFEMDRTEYPFVFPAEFYQYLNELGHDGWELFHILGTQRYLFKRELVD